MKFWAKRRINFYSIYWFDSQEILFKEKNMTKNDFNMSYTNPNGTFVRLEEINEMIKLGIITIDLQKLNEYKFDTRIVYNKEKALREEAMKYWRFDY